MKSNATGETTSTVEVTYGKSAYILSTVGALGGLTYAFTKKKAFWGYVGFFVLGSVAGSLIGIVLDNTVFQKSEIKSGADGKSEFTAGATIERYW